MAAFGVRRFRTRHYIGRSIAAAGALAVAAAGLVVLASPGAHADQALQTRTNIAVDGSGACLNGPPNTNTQDCNIYTSKQYVWFDALGASLVDGDYFFAVTEPAGTDQNDGPAGNLSDNVDPYTARSFTLLGGALTAVPTGAHTVSGSLINVFNFADTTNMGGEYKLYVCSLAGGYPVAASDCKTDNFKVRAALGADLAISKTVDPTFNRDYTWSIAKAVDKTIVKQIGGSATFNYTVTAAQTGVTDSGWKATGVITVTNPNNYTVDGPITVSDAVDNGGVCSVAVPNPPSLPPGPTTVGYTCTWSTTPTKLAGTNTATVTWDKDANTTPAGTAVVSVPFSFSTPTGVTNKTVTVTDAFNGGAAVPLGTLMATDAPPFASAAYPYPRTVSVPAYGCQAYVNFATIVETAQQATQTVTVCGPAKTGALTIGFWQNNNGQAILKAGTATSGVCNAGTWLRTMAPFQDLSTSATSPTCSQVAAYVYNVVKAANASGATMNAMLKAQMLATALDVYFSDAALGGNKIAALAPLGGVNIDLTQLGTSAAFGGATSRTVAQLLAYAASQFTAAPAPAGTWYGNVKATQELAKNTFDAINNQRAFTA
jgi:hypothetical protein